MHARTRNRSRRLALAVLSGIVGVCGVAGIASGGAPLANAPADAAPDLPLPGPMSWVYPIAIDLQAAKDPIRSMPENMGPPIPLDQVPPMPMPNPDGWVPNPNPILSATYHNARTGETREMPLVPLPGDDAFGISPWGSYEGPDRADDDDQWTSRGFGTMGLLGNSALQSWPARANVKLYMRFRDQNGTSRVFTCSGSMTDAGVVLTAAHCIYAHDPLGYNIFDFAEAVYVYPAWDGQGELGGSHQHNIYNHFGAGRGTTSFLVGTGWITGQDLDRDVGLIAIDRDSRHVGMLTGWYASAWGDVCDLREIYTNYSYPAQNCGGGLHTGTRMYVWSGTWDACPGGNQLELHTTPGCLTAVWGGMSGSAAYYEFNRNLFAHAVCSTSNRTTQARYVRQWQSWILSRNTFVSQTRGQALDLQAMRLRWIGNQFIGVRAGAQTPEMEVLVTNPTNFSDWIPRDYTLRMYLSESRVLNEATDTLLATLTYRTTWDQMQTRTFMIPPLDIPIDTPMHPELHSHHVIAVLDSGTDQFPKNNYTVGWDGSRLLVNPPLPPSPPLVSPLDGATGIATTPVALFWESSVHTETYQVYFGAETDPPFVGTTVSNQWILPPLNVDTQYYWRIVGVNAQGSTSSETWTFRTEPAPFVDLSANWITVSSGNYQAGDMIAVSHEVQNIGNSTSGAYTLEIRASTDATISAADPLLSTTTHGPLSPNSTRTQHGVPTPLPADLAPGMYYIGSRIVSAEDANDANNTAVSADVIHVVEACPADLSPPFGVLDIFDVLEFLARFDAQDPTVDFAPPFGVFDIFDVLEFLTLFESGCP